MKKIVKIVLFVIVALTMTSCQKKITYTTSETNGVKTVINNGIPANPNLNVKLEKIHEIQGFNELTNNIEDIFFVVKDFAVSSNDDVFIYDDNECFIYKYDHNGRFLKKFGGKGNGPGECQYNKRVLLIHKNQLYSYGMADSNVFDLNGNFVRKDFNNLYKLPDLADCIDDNVFIKCYGFDKRGPDLMNDFYALSLIYKTDNLFSNLDRFPKIIETSVANCFYDHGYLFLNEFCLAVADKSIFVTTRSKEKYEFYEYDTDMKLIKNISMRHQSKEYSSKELISIEKNLVTDEDKGLIQRKYWHEVFDKKVAIHDLYFDKQNNYLLVANAPNFDSHSIRFDIFKEGVYINNFNLKLSKNDYNPMPQSTIFRVNNGKLYYYSEDTNSITVYKISYQI